MEEIKVSKFDLVFGVTEIAEALAGFYTAESAAQELGVKRLAVYRMIDDGRLEGGKIVDAKGDLIKVLVSKRSVERYLDWRAQDPRLGHLKNA